MTTLTPSQISFLQRFADGEATLPEQRDGKELLKTEQAQALLAELETLQAAARVAEEAIWAKNTRTTATILAGIPGDVMAAPIIDLHPLLERFFDGECDDAEAGFVAELIDERPEVAEYLAELDTLRAGVRVFDEDMGARVDLSSLWSGIESRLDQSELKAEQKALLNRHFDGEVSATEESAVAALLESHADARALQGALAELRLATQAAMDTASEGVDFAPIWGAVEAAMDADLEAQGENIVALGSRRREKESFFRTYRQSILGAVAALVAVAFAGSLFGGFMTPERVIVERTIVIVDSVEYAPGSSVMVNSPVQRASVISEPGTEVEEPTVIWLLDSGEDNLEENQPSGQPI